MENSFIKILGEQMLKDNITTQLGVIIRRTLYIALGNLDKLLKRETKLVVYCYHSIEKNSWRFSIAPEAFKQQISYLQGKYNHMELEEFITTIQGGKQISKPSFLLTFDDGYKDLLEIASFLKTKNINPVLFTLSETKNVLRESLKTQKTLLSNSELQILSKIGWAIESHGDTHLKLKNVPEEKLISEIVYSKLKLEKLLAKTVKAFSYPHGYYTEKSKALVKSAGYEIAFSMDDAELNNGVDIYTVPRVGVDATHSYSEFVYLASPSVIAFRKFLKKLL